MKKSVFSKLKVIGLGIIILFFGVLMNFYTDPGYARAEAVITKL